MKNRHIAVVIPFYDGLDTIQELVQRIALVFSKLPYDHQVIVVDDSADKVKRDTLHNWFRDDEKLSLITLSKNHGQHFATNQGLKVAKGCSVITIDEDLQYCPEDIPELIEVSLQGKFDVVYGNRKRRDWRYWGGRAMMALFLPNGPGITCSFRMINKETVNKLINQDVNFCVLEGMIYGLNPNYGYANVQFNNTGRGNNRSSYSMVKVFFLISNFIAFYSWFPIVSISIVCLIVQFLLFLNTGLLALFFLPISGVSVLTLTAYMSARTVQNKP